jgi:hypothetical protein
VRRTVCLLRVLWMNELIFLALLWWWGAWRSERVIVFRDVKLKMRTSETLMQSVVQSRTRSGVHVSILYVFASRPQSSVLVYCDKH